MREIRFYIVLGAIIVVNIIVWASIIIEKLK